MQLTWMHVANSIENIIISETSNSTITMQGFLKLSQFIENHKTFPWEPLESTLNLWPTKN